MSDSLGLGVTWCESMWDVIITFPTRCVSVLLGVTRCESTWDVIIAFLTRRDSVRVNVGRYRYISPSV